MIATMISILMIMLGYFLILYGAVAFIQDKRLFSSAPKEVQAAIQDKKERFTGAHVVGWVIIAAAVLLFIGAFAFAIYDGARNSFNMLDYFVRFLIMLYAMEIYDIIFFDWYLLCHSNFYPHFYPEVKEIVGPHLFGFNRKSHIIHFIVYIPISAALAWGCGILLL